MALVGVGVGWLVFVGVRSGAARSGSRWSRRQPRSVRWSACRSRRWCSRCSSRSAARRRRDEQGVRGDGRLALAHRARGGRDHLPGGGLRRRRTPRPRVRRPAGPASQEARDPHASDEWRCRMSERSRSNRKFFAGFLLVALLIAGRRQLLREHSPRRTRVRGREDRASSRRARTRRPRTARSPTTPPRASTTRGSAAASPASSAACWSSASAAACSGCCAAAGPTQADDAANARNDRGLGMGAGHGHRLHYHGHSVVHRAPAHLKLVTLVTSCSSWSRRRRSGTPPSSCTPSSWLGVIALSRVPPLYLAKRMLIETPFVLFALLVPFVADGPQVEVLGVTVSEPGLLAAAALLVKGSFGVLAALTLAATTDAAGRARRTAPAPDARPARADHGLHAALPRRGHSRARAG